MTTETVQDVLREMREAAGDYEQWGRETMLVFADRIERALAGSKPIAEVILKQNPSNPREGYKVFDCVSPVLICQEYPVGTKFHAHPAIGNKPAVDDAMVERAVKAALQSGADTYAFTSKDMRAALTAALIDSAQDGKGE